LLEIDRRPLSPSTDRRPRQGFGRGVRCEDTLFDRDDRQARARTRDRGADRDPRRVELGDDGQLGKRALSDEPHPPEIGDDAGKHIGTSVDLEIVPATDCLGTQVALVVAV
jgi:hypothetical protein